MDSRRSRQSTAARSNSAAESAKPSRPNPVVLHVVEAYGGGVMTAIHDYIARTGHCDHVVLGSLRPGFDTGSGESGSFRFIHLPRRPVAALRAIRRAVADLDPDIIHAHSSIAGAVVRVCPGVPTDRIVYTPHCFAFERQDLRLPMRMAYRMVERRLAGRTRLVVACSPRELALAQGLGIAGAYVPNVADVPARPITVSQAPTEATEVVAVGRLANQKDPQYFGDMARAFTTLHPDLDVRFVWLGGGSDERGELLQEAGVEVSGWLPRTEVMARLAGAHAYVHTALWEGAPLTLLEAAALGVPIVVRNSPSVASLGLDELVDSPVDAAERLHTVLTSGLETDEAGAALRERHSIPAQTVALRSAYADVIATVAETSAAATAGHGAGSHLAR